MSPFEVVYGLNPLTPLDLKPIPQADQVNLDALNKSEYVKKLHQTVKENIEKKTEEYKRKGDKGRKELIFKPGEWVWLHLRPERFPRQRRSKLAPRGDGPFKVLEKINDNAYKLELPGEFNISHSFNVADLSPFDVDETVLRTKHFQEGGNDDDIDPNQDQSEVPTVREGPMTRSRLRTLREKFNLAVERIMSSLEIETMSRRYSAQENNLATRRDQWEDLNHHQIIQAPAGENQGTLTYFVDQGVQNTKKHEEISSELQVIKETSTLANGEQEPYYQEIEAGNTRSFEAFTHTNSSTLHEHSTKEKLLKNATNQSPNQPHQFCPFLRQNQVFSISIINAGATESSTDHG